ncbi:GMC family oxidoreductase N-terminal domain-containing protein [Microbacterium murale]|uniref:Glucose-methanol-choline oxidoreductase n=1 Tax=Microbacterium murale TaxID=1081040 RepID=A0ABQ1RHK0_9MICO|nr:GMC family oxidoreductase N-terminal domain-containing protein [Microbacterium murale]GGD70050.1 glucose-methanol-choline oxidoreductase [Microbacterium murale]
MNQAADFIVVGGGGSGVPLASRLADELNASVILIEAGLAPNSAAAYPPALRSAASLEAARPGHLANWSWPAHLQPDRPWTIARGRVLGGSTAINGGYFVRATTDDFHGWARYAPAWTYELSLPFMRKLETDLDFGRSPLHGGFGPMPVSRPAQDHPITMAFAGAAAKLGFTFEHDKNGAMRPGYGPLPMNVVDGIRVNTAMAYPLGSVTIRERTNIRRIVFRGTSAVGVETSNGEIINGQQMILCAGGIGSALLLLRSGIGPRNELSRGDVPIVHESEGVGASFSDHPQMSLSWFTSRAIPRASTIMASSLDAAYAEYIPLLSSVSELRGGNPDDRRSLLVGMQESSSRGTITLEPGRPEPRIRYNYLSHPSDVSKLRHAVRQGAALLREFDEISDRNTDLDRLELEDDARLDAWIRSHLGTAQHLSGSAPFAPTSEGHPRVVDQFGKVDGVSNLRVADISILPTVPRRGTAATAVLIGERVADFIAHGF